MELATGQIDRLAAVAGIVIVGVLFAHLLRHRISGLTTRDQLRAASYLTRYATALEYAGVHKHDARRHVAALRNELTQSAKRTSLDDTLERLGPPRARASSVTCGPLGPSWLRGLLWVLLAAIAVTVAIAAFVAGFETATETHQTSRWTGPLASGIEITTDTMGNASTVDLTMPAAVPAALIVFLIGSRTWRLATRRSQSSPTPQSDPTHELPAGER